MKQYLVKITDEAIDAAVERLMAAAQKIGEKLNAQAQQAQQAQPQHQRKA